MNVTYPEAANSIDRELMKKAIKLLETAANTTFGLDNGVHHNPQGFQPLGLHGM
jgi:hypothetical protein